jgi:hypothetical protein
MLKNIDMFLVTDAVATALETGVDRRVWLNARG